VRSDPESFVTGLVLTERFLRVSFRLLFALNARSGWFALPTFIDIRFLGVHLSSPPFLVSALWLFQQSAHQAIGMPVIFLIALRITPIK
jgi:hypothetical protein